MVGFVWWFVLFCSGVIIFVCDFLAWCLLVCCLDLFMCYVVCFLCVFIVFACGLNCYLFWVPIGGWLWWFGDFSFGLVLWCFLFCYWCMLIFAGWCLIVCLVYGDLVVLRLCLVYVYSFVLCYLLCLLLV